MDVERSSAPVTGGTISRPDRDSVYLEMAQLISQRSTCLRAEVGCVITDVKGFVIATGYNGAPPGMPHCIDDTCFEYHGHCIATLHAEANAMARFVSSSYPLICYCTHSPCLSCLKVGVSKGIMSWVFINHYVDESRDAFLMWYNTNLKRGDTQLQLTQMRWEGELGRYTPME